jgi:acyl-coenzyme A thioesterase PaaI-like protein
MTAVLGPTVINNDNVVDTLFAIWLKVMGLTELKVAEGSASAIFPQNSDLQWANGAICVQPIMAAIDSIVSLAIGTGAQASKSTASQNTQFLRPALGEDLRIESKVLKFGKTIAYAETHDFFVGSGKLVAHATNEFAY